jgi:hypothetical protein
MRTAQAPTLNYFCESRQRGATKRERGVLDFSRTLLALAQKVKRLS